MPPMERAAILASGKGLDGYASWQTIPSTGVTRPLR